MLLTVFIYLFYLILNETALQSVSLLLGTTESSKLYLPEQTKLVFISLRLTSKSTVSV